MHDLLAAIYIYIYIYIYKLFRSENTLFKIFRHVALYIYIYIYIYIYFSLNQIFSSNLHIHLYFYPKSELINIFLSEAIATSSRNSDFFARNHGNHLYT